MPPDGRHAVLQLPIVKGYSCMDCCYLIANRNRIAIHQIGARYIRVRGGRGRGGGEEEGSSKGWRQVLLQSFSLARQYTRYWIIWDGDNDSSERSISIGAKGSGKGSSKGSNEGSFKAALR